MEVGCGFLEGGYQGRVIASFEIRGIEPRKTRKDTEMGMLEYEEETYLIRGAIFEVYKEMGCGFLEPVYQECLERELVRRNIPYVPQAELRLSYKGEPLSQIYRPDFVCFDKIIIEIKSVKTFVPEHKAQLINYLKATRIKLGLLVNFGSHPQATVERLIL